MDWDIQPDFDWRGYEKDCGLFTCFDCLRSLKATINLGKYLILHTQLIC